MKWLLLRGLGRHIDHWGKFAEDLSNSSDQVLRLNFPGIEKGHQAQSMSIADITDELRAEFLKSRTQGDDWSICAISLGGMVAIDWAHRYPQDFKNIVTINSSATGASKFYQRLRPYAIKTFIELMFEKDIRKREKKILELTTNMIQIDEKRLDWSEEIARKYSLEKKLVLKQLTAAAKFRLPGHLNIPLFVLASKHDRLASSQCSKNIAKHFHAPYIEHPNAGHDLPLDDPQWVLNKLENV